MYVLNIPRTIMMKHDLLLGVNTIDLILNSLKLCKEIRDIIFVDWKDLM